MASYDSGEQSVRQSSDTFDPDIGGNATEPSAENAIGRLPGVVNDLPEVAPHEWIYIMS